MARRLAAIPLLFILALALTPQVTFGCSCYDADGSPVSVDASSRCQEADLCDEATAIEDGDEGVCTCSTESLPFDCTDFCTEAGYSASAPKTGTTINDLVPNLSIDIPGVSFSSILSKGGVLSINFLQDYIAGVYKFLLGIGTLIAIVMVMIGGLQYTIAAGTGDVKKAQERIRNAVTGLALLMSVYLLLAAVNPNLVFFKPLRLLNIEGQALEKGINNDEGADSSSSNGSSSGGAYSSACDDLARKAVSKGACEIQQLLIFPTGEEPICDYNSHWTDERGIFKDYTEITELDFKAEFGTPIMAPMDGTVTYIVGEDTKCGNWITLTGSGKAEGAQISFCHAKDFLNDAGQYLDNTTVSQGDTIGHTGGSWCAPTSASEGPPADWEAGTEPEYVFDGTECTDPTIDEDCDCQNFLQAGLSKKAHLHMQWHTGGDLLACFEDY